MSDSTSADMDGGWKQIIEDFIEEFFRFYFPKIHALINFKADIQFLDKELAKIMVDTQTGKLIAWATAKDHEKLKAASIGFDGW